MVGPRRQGHSAFAFASERHHDHDGLRGKPGVADSAHMANIQQTGVNALCDKPFEPTEVRQMLAALLGNE